MVDGGLVFGAVHLVDGGEPLEDTLGRIRQEAQRCSAEGAAGGVNETLAGADFGNSLSGIEVTGDGEGKSCNVLVDHVRCLGDGTVGVVDDGNGVTRATQCGGVAGAQRREAGEGADSLGAYLCDPGAKRSVVQIVRAAEQGQSGRDINGCGGSEPGRIWDVVDHGDVGAGGLAGEELAVDHGVDDAAEARCDGALGRWGRDGLAFGIDAGLLFRGEGGDFL